MAAERCDKGGCTKTAIYREKKRRHGKLTRDQYCAGHMQWAYGQFGIGPEDFKRIEH